MNSLSRRRFLKISSAAVALAAAGTMTKKIAGQNKPYINPDFPVREGVQKIPTFCDICFWKCGAIAYMKDGKLWKIEGNPDDPLSNGRLCPRGTGGIGAHYDPDRLRVPLMSRNNRGSEEWTAVNWDEALDFIAGKMQKIKAEYGPEAVALFSHGIGGNFLKHMIKAYGSTLLPRLLRSAADRAMWVSCLLSAKMLARLREPILRMQSVLHFWGRILEKTCHNSQGRRTYTAIVRCLQ